MGVNKEKKVIRSVIFDMDGVLIDSEPIWRKAEQLVFRKVGILLNDDLCKQTMGYRVNEVVEFWYNQSPWSQMTCSEVEQQIIQTVIDLIRTEGRPLPGALQAVEHCVNSGYKIALASSSYYRIIDAVLDRIRMPHVFQTICSAEDEPLGKPHPAVFLRAANQLNVNPPECLVIEDSVMGMVAAVAAKMRCVVVPAPEDFADPRFNLVPDKIRSLIELPDYLNINFQ